MPTEVLYSTQARATGGRDGTAGTLDGAFKVTLSTPPLTATSAGPIDVSVSCSLRRSLESFIVVRFHASPNSVAGRKAPRYISQVVVFSLAGQFTAALSRLHAYLTSLDITSAQGTG